MVGFVVLTALFAVEVFVAGTFTVFPKLKLASCVVRFGSQWTALVTFGRVVVAEFDFGITGRTIVGPPAGNQ